MAVEFKMPVKFIVFGVFILAFIRGRSQQALTTGEKEIFNGGRESVVAARDGNHCRWDDSLGGAIDLWVQVVPGWLRDLDLIFHVDPVLVGGC
ncbi:hypothetical protein EVAR_97775_1 [Eumeta japonica]|uniref:Uncharacterized protein n=1 Tax=Eumeta variegata TaxID=151549 RepID=A0A4C1Y4T4_EUMVA|nr:hypothetical protein EVAR_97775_1 [Eumeta japonica]